MASVAPTPRLVSATSGDGVTLGEGRTWVGRAADCQLQLDDRRVSRWHAVVDVAGQAVAVTDLQSTAGTTVDGAPIVGAAAVADGAVIAFGPSVWRLSAIGQDSDVTAELPVRRVELTGRQRQVLVGLVAGDTQETIARRLGVSERAVAGVCRRLYDRLGVSGQAEAVAVAVRDELL